MNNMTDTVKQLLLLNILFFVGSYFVPQATDLLALHYFESAKFQLWQPLSHMFMHGNLMHIFFNMFALVSFGSALEHFWGPKKFLFFYFSCGIGAALIHSGVNYYYFHDALNTLMANGFQKAEIFKILNEGKFMTSWQAVLSPTTFDAMIGALTPTVGASGAIYGLLVAFAFMFPNAELALLFIPVPIKAKYFVPAIVLLDLFSGVTGYSIFGGGIAHFAHVGGAAVGFLMMWYWKKNQFNQNRWDR
ncbi:rhomboid family intramembrane serine protease [Flavobacterium sp.]|uniref:rhomboid family intramembrane serine protease n=1 Tax=Flavobacterium sp. TaxID=239 RepID=UPI0037BFC32D